MKHLSQKLPYQFIDYNQFNSGTCWLVRPIQCLNVFLSHKTNQYISVSLPYIYLKNLYNTTYYAIEFKSKEYINGGGTFSAFQQILNNEYYLDHEVHLKVNIFDRKVSKYILKKVNQLRKRSLKGESKKNLQKDLYYFIYSLFEVKNFKKKFYFSAQNLIYNYFDNYMSIKSDIIAEPFKNLEIEVPYRRSNYNGLCKEFNKIKKSNYQLWKPERKIYQSIINNINYIKKIINQGDIPLISFLYNKEQSYLKQQGFKSNYGRHLALIESYDKKYFYLRDSRDNIDKEYSFPIEQDKLIFLSGELKIFKYSKILTEKEKLIA